MLSLDIGKLNGALYVQEKGERIRALHICMSIP